MTTGFDRRQLLHLSGLGLAALGLAPWIERAFAQEGGAPPRSPRAEALAGAWTRARLRGRPMLVFLVPVVRDAGQRGTLLARYLQSAPERAHAELTLCEVACATVVELRALFPGVELRFEGEPLAVIVGVDGRDARAVLEKVPSLPPPRFPGGEPLAPAEIEDRKKWADSMARELHAALTGNPGSLEHWVREARAHLTPEDRERLATLESRSERWSARDVALCPTWAFLSRTDHTAELAKLSRSLLVEHAPAGSRWAERWGGCGGVKLEDPTEMLRSPVACGIGCVPEESRRFLWLYTKSDP